MQITINGEAEQFSLTSLNITKLLELKNVESPDMVSVQLNGEIVDREQYESTSVNDNDELDFLYFMGGGAR